MEELTMSRLYKILIFNAIFLLSGTAHALAVDNGSNFENGTDGWGHTFVTDFSPTIISDNGPSEPGNSALQVLASGQFGAGGRLLALNSSEAWKGSFDADVTSLTMDLKHLSGTDLAIRIAITDGDTWYASQTAHNLSSGGDWEQAIFSFSDLGLMEGVGSLADVKSGIKQVRILHSLAVNFRGDKIAASFAVDNVSAVPLPGAVWLFTAAIGLLGFKTRKK